MGPAQFATRQVCRTCNSLCGLWVDGGFTKNFFAHNEAHRAAEEFVDPDRPGPMPLIYMGIDTEFECAPDEICERWTGPAGEHVYHLHARDEPKWDAYSGGDVIRRKRSDPGRVYVYLTSVQPYWVFTTFHSVAARFPDARRRCLTQLDGPSLAPVILGPEEGEISETEAREIAFLRARTIGPRNMSFSLRLEATDRFMAKLALGFGHTLLGPKVSASPYAQDLRRVLWRRADDPEDPPVRVRGNTGYQGQVDGAVSRLLGFEGAWTLTFTSSVEGFALGVVSPGLRFMSIVISEDSDLWAPGVGEHYAQGQAYVFVPAREMVVGPMPLLDLVGHRTGASPHPDLVRLEALKRYAARRPAKHPPPPI